MLRDYCFRLFICLQLTFLWTLQGEESFILIDGQTDEVITEMGRHLDERTTPCSTFKVVLSLIGFDTGVLQNANSPTWDYQEGFDDYLECWKAPHTPALWLKQSCLWYSKILTQHLGKDTIQTYLELLHYGNRDFSGGLTQAWLNSSLKISAREQTYFMKKLAYEELPLSIGAIRITKSLLLIEQLPNGYRLYGKTGMGSVVEKDGTVKKVGWLVGWFEKDNVFLPFAYQIRDASIDPTLRIPRVKELFLISEDKN